MTTGKSRPMTRYHPRSGRGLGVGNCHSEFLNWVSIGIIGFIIMIKSGLFYKYKLELIDATEENIIK